MPDQKDGDTFKDRLSREAGWTLEQMAHGLSLSRAAGGLMIAHEVRNDPDYQSWKLAGTFALLASTDLIDGMLARLGRKLQHKDDNKRRVLNAYIDKIPDKVLVDAVGEAIAAREHENGHELYAAVAGTATKVDIARNIVTTTDSVVADVQGIDTCAISSGKWKATRQYAVETFALSPLANSQLGRIAAGAGFAYSAVESVESGIQLHQHLQAGRQALETSELIAS